MSLLLTGGTVFWKGHFQNMDLAMDQGRIVSVPQEAPSVISLPNCLIVPGFVDVHVHLREPGFSYKETISTGTAAAAAGGYTAVCAMPNLSPVPDSLEHLRVQQELIARHAKVRVYPYGSITQGEQGSELADLAALAPYVAGFSDDGRGVQSEPLMRRAMELAKKLERPIVAHSEDESLLSPGWAVHDGDFARRHGLIGNNPESEWRQVERDLRLVRETGCRYHVCHISTKESVALIRQAKAEGLPVTCETGPHYLVLCDEDLQEDGRFKMNPPLRSRSDREALLEGVADGTVDVIATDHAPHSAAEKEKGLSGSAMGIVGLETAFPVLYTKLVRTGVMTFEKLIQMMAVRPREIFDLPVGEIVPGAPADLCLLDTDCNWTVDPDKFVTMGRATPFAGWQVQGKNRLTVWRGEVVYEALR